MKKLFIAASLMLSFFISAQDTTYTIKSINKDRIITGYLIVHIVEHKVVKTIRIDSYIELEKLNLRRNAKAKIYLNEIPKDKLKEDEYLKNGVRNNNN